MSMIPSRVGENEPPKKVTENIFEATARRNREQAAKDPAFAARLEMEKRRAKTSYAVDHDLGGD